jgi:hypothetical protein
MKKKWLLFPILTIVFIFTLLPLGSLNANPGNLVKNGDFSDGFNHWNAVYGTASVINGAAYLGPGSEAYIEQYYFNTSNKNLKFSFDVKPMDYGSSGGMEAGFWILKNGVELGEPYYYYEYPYFSLDAWHSDSFKIRDLWHYVYGTNIPDFDQIGIWVETYDGAIAYFDNIKLVAPEKEAVEEGFIRTMPMTCYQVWVNSDNKFEFVFWYPYRDNNWVKIYDMSGKEVYSVDMPLDDPHIIVDLPNGMYTVKTFNDDPATPIQIFVIGK